MSLAPIALFVYNRVEHTQKIIEALQLNDLSSRSNIIIFSDAAKDEKSIDKVLEVRKYVKSITGFKSIQIIERQENLGLAESIIDGVTAVVAKFGKVIVLEDDILTSPFFLTYMNNSLDLYQEEEAVVSIHAYNYPVQLDITDDTFFLKGADCWGWATWKRGWDLFESNGLHLLNQLKELGLEKDFNFNDTYPFTQMLKMQIAKKNDSWAIRWYASAFLKNKLTLYPTKTLVYNIGLDNSGTHSGKDIYFNASNIDWEPLKELKKLETKENLAAKRSIEFFFRKHTKLSLKQRLKKLISF